MAKVITILCHGTANSTNTDTSEGFKLVITKIRNLLAGADEWDWILCEGAGTEELRHQRRIVGGLDPFGSGKRWQHPGASWPPAQGVQGGGVPQARALQIASSGFGGVIWGQGVEANVARALDFVAMRGPMNLTVNLAGHSRGSMTCYKIANELFRAYGPNVPVNIFAIDPVPGNTGRINKEMYHHIALGDNVDNSFLMLAESEHRQTFRPYIDEIYSRGGNQQNQFDTMPGTHGGINMLKGSEAEAAALVLSRALRFLQANGTIFNGKQGKYILDDNSTVDRYSEMMTKLKNYKADASMKRAENFAMSFANVERHRIVNVAGTKRPSLGARMGEAFDRAIAGKLGTGGGNETKDTWGTDQHQVTDPDTRGRADHHGLKLGTALQRMGVDPHAERPHRFFANKEHEALFQRLYPPFIREVKGLESTRAMVGSPECNEWAVALQTAIAHNVGAYLAMPQRARDYFNAFCRDKQVSDNMY